MANSLWELPPEKPNSPKSDPVYDYWKETAFRRPTANVIKGVKPLPVNEFGDPLGPSVTYKWPKATENGQWELPTNPLNWQSWGIPWTLVRELKQQHVSFPSDIQVRGLQAIRTGRQNLMLQAPTGSGKTLTFVLGTLMQVDSTNPAVQVLCLSPTVELSTQLASVFWVYAQSLRISVSLVKQVWTATQVVVMNPFQCIAMLRQEPLPFLKFLVLDEADYMLQEPRFTDIIPHLQSLLKPARTLLISSTYSDSALASMDHWFSPCERLGMPPDELIPANLRLYYAEVADAGEAKTDMLELLLAMPSPGVTVVFVNFTSTAEALVHMFRKRGVRSAMLAGYMSVEQRRNTLSLFHRGQLAVLVTTNLLAWGIDEVTVSRVVNFDFPVHRDTGLADAEMFLRRVGRAGRFGRPGVAISIVTCEAEMCMLEDVMVQWGCNIESII